jgi:CxxC-x17-CxxC domain-containing protein
MAQSYLPDGECGVKNQVSRRNSLFQNFFRGFQTMYEDKTLVCKDCGAEFVFTAGEQEFYAEKGFQNEPTRCRACRQARKARTGAAPARELFDAVCAECGNAFQIHFQPREDRPVYCSACFQARRG